MTRTCSSCGSANREEAKFCQNCGWLLETTGQPITKVRPFHEARIRCSECRASENIEVCHVCGKLVCNEHKAHPTLTQTYTQEFAPALSGKQKRAVHCQQHPHFVKSPLRTKILPGLALLLAALWVGVPNGARWYLLLASEASLAFSDIWRPTSWLLLAVVLIAGSVVLSVYGLQEFFREFLPQVEGQVLNAIPVIPEQYVVKIKEWIELDLTIGKENQAYQSIAAAGGDISVQALLPPTTPNIIRAYREKCSRNHWLSPRQLSVGFLAVDQLSVIEIPYAQRMPDSPNVMPLRLSAAKSQGNSGWQDLLNNTYLLKKETLFEDREHTLPGRSLIWLKPELAPYSAGRTLQLVFDVAPDFFGNRPVVLRNLRLSIPKSAFGDHEVGNPVLSTNGRFHADRWEVQWVDWPLGAGEAHPHPTVQFTRALTTIGQDLTLTFEIEVEEKTLSEMQIGAQQIWLPNGQRLQDGKTVASARSTTMLKGHATVAPSIFSYQYEVKAHEAFATKAGPLRADAIGNLTRVLETKGIYVRTVKENAPVTEPHEIMKATHTWDLLGRLYSEIRPIDVHVVLTERYAIAGPELVRQDTSQIAVEVTLRSLATTKTGDFEGKVTAECQKVAQALKTTLALGVNIPSQESEVENDATIP